MEDEAEESDEEGQVAGLGDFGFTRTAKDKDPDEDERVVADEDDFENIVDELSDGEGDEEALARARTEMAREEDKAEKAEVCLQQSPSIASFCCVILV